MQRGCYFINQYSLRYDDRGLVDAINYDFPILVYNRRRYGYYFLITDKFIFTHEGKNAICVSKDTNNVIDHPHENQRISEDREYGWLGNFGSVPIIQRNSVPTEDTEHYSIKHLSDIDQGEPDILDNTDNEKIRKIIKQENICKKLNML